MPSIKLKSSDGEIFDVDVEVTNASTTIKNLLEHCGMSEDDKEPLPLPKVTGAILKKVIEWATFHKGDPPPPEENENELKRTDDICAWDLDFLKVDIVTLFELIRAADYLNITVLLDTCCKAVANKIKGKTPEEIRLAFNLKDIILKKRPEDGPTTDGGAEGGSTPDGGAKGGPNPDGGAENGPTADGGAENGPTTDGKAENVPTTDGGAENGPTTDGGAENGPTTDGGAEAAPSSS